MVIFDLFLMFIVHMIFPSEKKQQAPASNMENWIILDDLHQDGFNFQEPKKESSEQESHDYCDFDL